MGDEKEEKNKEKGDLSLSLWMPFFVPAVKKGPFSFSWHSVEAGPPRSAVGWSHTRPFLPPSFEATARND